jgi:hypothetical protein
MALTRATEEPMQWRYRNRAGEAISIEECARLYHDHSYRIVAQDTVGERLVSTIWLGVGQIPPFGPRDAPSVFETMVLGGKGDEPQWRWSTEAEALAGHATVVRTVQDSLTAAPPRRNEPIIPADDRPIAEPEDGSVDISGLDKAELLAALVNATKTSPFHGPPMTLEQASAIIQDELSAGEGRPFDFDYVDGRPIKCDIGGPRISAYHVARYDRDSGEGNMARVVGELRAADEQRRAERDRRHTERDES